MKVNMVNEQLRWIQLVVLNEKDESNMKADPHSISYHLIDAAIGPTSLVHMHGVMIALL